MDLIGFVSSVVLELKFRRSCSSDSKHLMCSQFDLSLILIIFLVCPLLALFHFGRGTMLQDFLSSDNTENL